jgi:LacI family transcriptional regulator
MKALLDLAEPSTAFFWGNNRNIIGALREIETRLRTPGCDGAPHAVPSFDDFEQAELMPEQVTVVDHGARELGREAARTLFERLTGGGVAGPTRRIDVPTHVRAACA